MKPFCEIVLEHFSELDSTSLYLKKIIRAGDVPPDLVTADGQTDGRGRAGRSFFSPKGTGFYATYCLPRSNCPANLTPRTALAVRDAILKLFGIECGIKWVNDLFRDGRKICGILCQSVGEYDLIGVGINLAKPKRIPDEIKNTFGSLFSEVPPEAAFLAETIYECLSDRFSRGNDEVLRDYKAACMHLGWPVSVEYDGQLIVGRSVDIAPDFSLVVDVNGDVRTFSSGFVSLRI